MSDWFYSPTTQLALLVVVTGTAIAGGIFVIAKIREGRQKGQHSASDMLTGFRDLHAQGDLSDEEYRTIKTMLSDRIGRELQDNEERG